MTRSTQDTDSSDRHSGELVEGGSMVVAYPLTPREMATSICGDIIADGPFVDAKEVNVRFRNMTALAGHGNR